METPATLIEAIPFFNDPNNALAYMVSRRWPNGVTCTHCDAPNPMFLEKRSVWKCRKCRKQFSIKTGTIFEDSPLPLGKWLLAVWLVTNCKNGVSSYEIARDAGVTQKSAWFMLHRIREAMQDEKTGGKLGGEVEVDETYIGGKARNMHADRRKRTLAGKGGGHSHMTAVQGILERDGKVRTKVVKDAKYRSLIPTVYGNVEIGSTVYTDQANVYSCLQSNYIHNVINHLECYVQGNVHTNGIENFWSLLKRGLGGTYVSVEPFHLFRYVDEQAMRFNYRKATDAQRFAHVCTQVVGRRLTWKRLTGKQEQVEERF